MDNQRENETEIALIDLYLRVLLNEMESIGGSQVEQESTEVVSR